MRTIAVIDRREWVHDRRAERRYLLRLRMMMTATTSHIGVSTTPPHGGSPARRRTIERLALALLVIVVAAVPASAQNSAGSNQEPGTVRWDDGTIRFGD